MKMRCKECSFVRRNVKKWQITWNLIDMPVNENPIDFIQSGNDFPFHFYGAVELRQTDYTHSRCNQLTLIVR